MMGRKVMRAGALPRGARRKRGNHRNQSGGKACPYLRPFRTPRKHRAGKKLRIGLNRPEGGKAEGIFDREIRSIHERDSEVFVRAFRG